MDGRPVRILAFPIPKDPVKGPWKPVVLSEELHVVHNIWTETGKTPAQSKGPTEIWVASYEGLTVITRWSDEKSESYHIGEGNQENPKGNRGSSAG